MKKSLSVFVLSFLLLSGFALAQGRVARGELFYDGMVVRTIIPPATNMPHPGRDNLYVVVSTVAGQMPVAEVAPGDRNYHGGQWAVHIVTFNNGEYLLTSADDIWAAENLGDVTITRMPEADFKCPIQP